LKKKACALVVVLWLLLGCVGVSLADAADQQVSSPAVAQQSAAVTDADIQAQAAAQRTLLDRLIATAQFDMDKARHLDSMIADRTPNSPPLEPSTLAQVLVACSAASATVHRIAELDDPDEIPFLVDNFLFVDENYTGLYYHEFFPCLTALVALQSDKVLPVLVARVGSAPAANAGYESLTGEVLIEMVGKAAAIAYVRDQASKATDPNKKANLDAWAAQMEKIPDGPLN
jgi:hypothetical protein